MAYDFVLPIARESSTLQRFQVEDLRASVLFMVLYGFSSVCMCVVTRLFYARVSLLMNASSRPITPSAMCVYVQLNLRIKGDFTVCVHSAALYCMGRCESLASVCIY